VADGAGNYATLASTNPINVDSIPATIINVTATNGNSDYKA
jgi:hypothetical protein